MAVRNIILSIVITFAINVIVNAQTNETECNKAYPSDACCKKPGCMWVSCWTTPYHNKPIPHTTCHAISWEFGICTGIPDIVCPTGIGAFCREVGGECLDIPGSYCNTSANTPDNIAKASCQCAAIYAPGNKHDTSCTAISCKEASTCVALDPNSECANSQCTCKEGFHINSNSSVEFCIQKPATTIVPTTPAVVDECGNHTDQVTCCADEGCKYVNCSSKESVKLCYKLDATLHSKCSVSDPRPNDMCLTPTILSQDPCAAITDEDTCCGSIDCRYINCTDRATSQPHTGCHGKNVDLTSVCSDDQNMCKYAYVDSKTYETFQDNVRTALKFLHDMMSDIKLNQDQMLKSVDAVEKALSKVEKKLDKQIEGLKEMEKDLKVLRRENRRLKKKSEQAEEIVEGVADEQEKLEKAVQKLHVDEQ